MLIFVQNLSNIVSFSCKLDDPYLKYKGDLISEGILNLVTLPKMVTNLAPEQKVV